MMQRFFDGNFFNPTIGNLSLSQVIEELSRYIREKPEKFYDIVVGCDSSQPIKSLRHVSNPKRYRLQDRVYSIFAFVLALHRYPMHYIVG